MLKINNNTNLINDIAYHRSDNCNNRPDKTVIDTIIIHCISLPSGCYNNRNIIEFFTNNLDTNKDPSFVSLKDTKVSSHLLINRDGGIIQFVPFSLRAWHAGISKHGKRRNCNDYSIGIELEGSDDDIYSDLQYEMLIKITNEIINEYPLLDKKSIIGHSDVSPGRKVDPGSKFDWNRFLEAL